MASQDEAGHRGNVSVTTIGGGRAQSGGGGGGQFSYSANGICISVGSAEGPRGACGERAGPLAHDEDSADAEVSSIDFLQRQYEVNMRNKKKRACSATEPPAGAPPPPPAPERPMSWEGELSDSEMVIDTSVHEEGGELQSSRDSIDTLRGAPPAHAHALQHNRMSVLTGGRAGAASPGAPGHVPVAPAPLPPHHPLLDVAGLKREVAHAAMQEVKSEGGAGAAGSPLLPRLPRVHSTASTDSAVHSMYTHSVYSSPSASPRGGRHYTPSLSRNNSDASHSSCFSCSSEFSPAHSPVQSRHGGLYREVFPASPLDDEAEAADERYHHHVSRQQLINSPCPICGDKISGFHYGIFSCESCKGFFKRTVQNRKNYMCLRGGRCPVGVATRKKCPACRFDKCLKCGMKLEAIREDRTRGGRSTYQCSYSLSGAASTGSLLQPHGATLRHATSLTSVSGPAPYGRAEPASRLTPDIPPLLQEIMDVEHLWQYNEGEMRAGAAGAARAGAPGDNPLLAAAGVTAHNSSPDFLANLCNIADHRLYKIVKWCKSLPLFKNIAIDDQICLLINSWCELLVLSCCYRGVDTPGEVRVGSTGVTLQQSAKLGLAPCIERMLSFTEHLRRLRVDRYEYVALKVIVLLTSDAAELREAEKVRASQERALAALQAYTAARSPHAPSKFGELLLRIPELQRTCQYLTQVGKEMLNPSHRSKDGDGPSFNLLMELLRGDH